MNDWNDWFYYTGVQKKRLPGKYNGTGFGTVCEHMTLNPDTLFISEGVPASCTVGELEIKVLAPLRRRCSPFLEQAATAPFLTAL